MVSTSEPSIGAAGEARPTSPPVRRTQTGPTDERLRPCDRLSRDMDFRRVFKEGRRAGNDLMVVYVADNGTARSRLGIRVHRRVGSAVARNRIRRRLREVFRRGRESKDDLCCPPPGGLEIICAIKPGGDYSFAKLRTSFTRLVGTAARAAGESGRGRSPRRPQ